MPRLAQQRSCRIRADPVAALGQLDNQAPDREMRAFLQSQQHPILFDRQNTRLMTAHRVRTGAAGLLPSQQLESQ